MSKRDEIRQALSQGNFANLVRPPEDHKPLTIHQAAARLGVSTHTLRNWERSGTLVPIRTPGGHRRYLPEQITGLGGARQHLADVPTTVSEMNGMLSGLSGRFRPDETLSLRIEAAGGGLKFVFVSADGFTTYAVNIEQKNPPQGGAGPASPS